MKVKISYVETRSGQRRSTGSVTTEASSVAAAKAKFERDTAGEDKKVVEVKPVKNP